MSAAEIQALLRFLTADAKVPLATAISKAREMQQKQLGSPELISKSDVATLTTLFGDEKTAKSVLNVAKRMSKKRGAGQADAPTPQKKQRKDPFEVTGSIPPAEVEKSLELRPSTHSLDDLEGMEFRTNRAPLVLVFAAVLAKYTMPEQPPSSRLSLAQAVVSLGSQSKAKAIGLSTAATAEDEGWGQGQPVVKLMNREISVLKRWGYDWQASSPSVKQTDEIRIETTDSETPALWAIDLEQLKNLNGPLTFSGPASADTAGLPVYSPQSARNYVFRSFDTAAIESVEGAKVKKLSAAAASAVREANVSALVQSLELLFGSWARNLSKEDLDKRAWSWYVAVRPEVEHGVAGWGAKGSVKLRDILELRLKAEG